MKCILLYGIVFSLLAVFFSLSCAKERSCEGCTSRMQPPVALAGTDQIITLPLDSTSLDGSKSTDPDSNITSYLWTKIAGPSSFFISNQSTAQTQLTRLKQGIYLLELKVSDAGGLFSKDTVQIAVNAGVIARTADTTITDLIWHHWHPPNLPLTNTMDDVVYFHLETPENFLLNVPDSNIQVFVTAEPSSNWIEAHRWILNNYDCVTPYIFERLGSTIAVYTCRLDMSVVGKKVAVRVVIK
jgi:hypothetical protein